MVVFLGVRGRSEMLIEVDKLSEFLSTKEALECVPVPSSVRRDILHFGFFMPADQIPSEYAARVASTKLAVDGIAIHSSSVWARARFQMMGHATC